MQLYEIQYTAQADLRFFSCLPVPRSGTKSKQ